MLLLAFAKVLSRRQLQVVALPVWTESTPQEVFDRFDPRQGFLVNLASSGGVRGFVTGGVAVGSLLVTASSPAGDAFFPSSALALGSRCFLFMIFPTADFDIDLVAFCL